MEFLLGAIITLLTEAIKWAVKKGWKKELVRAVLIVLTFVLSLVAGAFWYILKQKVDIELVFQVWALSIGFYEVAVKSFLQPLSVKILKAKA